MLQDLISAHLISDYTIVEVPGSVNDLESTRRVRTARYRNYFPIFVTVLFSMTRREISGILYKNKTKQKNHPENCTEIKIPELPKPTLICPACAAAQQRSAGSG